MRTGHLFAGAGGGLYADLILGHRPVFAVEWDDYAAAALRERADEGWFPGLHLHHGDVRLFDPSDWQGRVDSLHAGFPCTDISLAGTGAGIDGEQSGLWTEVVRCARIIRPSELFLENSPAITSRGLGRVLGDLADLGYDARWCVLPASAVGAPHLRARWWCLARLADTSSRRRSSQNRGQMEQPRRAEVIGAGDDSHPYSMRELQQEGSEQEQRGGVGNVGKDVSYPIGTGSGIDQPGECKGRAQAEQPDLQQKDRETHAGNSEPLCESLADTDKARLQEREILTGSKSEAERTQERKTAQRIDWWATEPDLGRVVNGLANRGNRIKALGNGQVPLQAAVAYVLLSGGK